MEIKKSNKFQSKMMEEFKQNRKILELQSKYERGIIKEEDLTEDEKQSLIKFYEQQIDMKKNEIEHYKKVLNDYKEKIIIERNKLKKFN